MSDLDLIRQLGDRLGRPLAEISEDRFEQHVQAKYARGRANQGQINRDAYSLAEDGTVSGLFLQPVTSQILFDFPLNQLSHVRHLHLYKINLQSFSFLSELKGLTSLYLSSNRITDCSFLSELKGLTSLDLRRNGITDCSFLSELKGLTSLDLSGNRIKEIPQYLATGRLVVEVDEEYAFDCINLYNNPIEDPPLEIVRQGNAAILNYYAQLATQGTDHLYEAKMLIVGEGEAGKTTLAHKIPEPDCPLPHVDDRTRGISIQTHIFPCRNRDRLERSVARDFHLNIWDFGGQEIYHATHRFFLSKRSLYVLVANNRKDDTDFNYWLNIIERFAGNSPLIIVLNEKDDIQSSLNRAELLSRYPDSIKEIVAVNFKTQEETDQTKAQQRLKVIHNLIGHIEHCAQNLPHIGEPVPARWVDVRQAIEDDSRNYIYREQFDDICHAQDITASQDIDTLLSYLHDLGILLHFVAPPLLRNRVILKPAWATNAVYRIFDDDTSKPKQVALAVKTAPISGATPNIATCRMS
ncbi:MAG: COR domain-containing protein [Cyanobacteria bacterium P01_G01_bin.54]